MCGTATPAEILPGTNILSLNYLGNIRWFSKLVCTDCVIDIHEHYHKQSYRNRCEILSAGGRLPLIVNTIKGSNIDKPKMRDVRIDYSKRWQHQHWRSIVSAYRSAPFFDFYADRFEPFYRKRYSLLAELNRELLLEVMDMIGIDRSAVRFSSEYIDSAAILENGIAVNDLRDGISPKRRLAAADTNFRAKAYWQVFSDPTDFVADLSIIDLLMCEGPDALDIIRASHTYSVIKPE